MNTEKSPANSRGGASLLLRIAVLGLLILLFCGLIYLLYVSFGLDLFGLRKSGTTEKITYTVEFESVAPGTANKITQGSVVRDASGEMIGSIASLEADEPATIYSVGDGPWAVTEGHPTNLKVLVNIEVLASSDPEKGYSVKGKRIAVGAEYELILSGVTLRGTCIGLEATQTNGGTGK